MKNPVVSYVGWLLVLAAVIFYGYGIYEAIAMSLCEKTTAEPIAYPEVLSTTIGSMQTLLLTNLGIILGISIANPNSAMAKSLMLTKPKDGLIEKAPPPPMDIKEKVQMGALLIYIIALIACLITWGIKEF